MKYIDGHTLSYLVVYASVATPVTSILSILGGSLGCSTQDAPLRGLTLKRHSTYMNLDKVPFKFSNSSLGIFPALPRSPPAG
jgi:hypothetical protein